MSQTRIRNIAASLSALAALAALPPFARAAVTDVSQTPLLSASGTPVKPNLMFILDDSGSMDDNFLPETAGDFDSSKYGLYAAQCNGLAYDPTVTYAPPANADGTSQGPANISTVFNSPSSSGNVKINPVVSSVSATIPVQTGGSLVLNLNAAPSSTPTVGDLMSIYANGEKTAWMQGTVSAWAAGSKQLTLNITSASRAAGTNLVDARVVKSQASARYYYFTYGGSQSQRGYNYDSSGNVIKTGATGTVYAECNSAQGSSPGSGVFTKVDVTLANGQNYANWKAYYSTRMLMMKTVVSQAFKDIDDKFRVGYNTILNTSMSESGANADFLHVRDFDATQKSNFYTKLMGPKNGGYTPLRASLAATGRYFANKASGQDVDPVQYSCQKNFAILATDGAWNTNSESSSYGPFSLATPNANVGQQDGNADRPMKDRSGSTGGSTDSLADVAYYYYNTDLRTSTLSNCMVSAPSGSGQINICNNNVPSTGKDTANWQHMTTYTMSLGQNGIIKYDKDYERQTTGDFYQITQGTKQWPIPGNGKGAENVDDLWHAAVNGRGVYFNAADPLAVSNGLKTALTAISQVLASGSAVATSTLRPVPGNNKVFIARFTSGAWTGDVRAYKMDVNTGQPNVVTDIRDATIDNADWSASTQLKNRVTARNILYYDGGATLKAFTTTGLGTTRAALFANACSTTSPKLSQCALLSAADQTAANSSDNLLNFLRGTEVNYYRARTSKLGDVIGSSPVYVGAPPMKYADAGYSSYQSTNASRRSMVYVGANDGMLHAFDASTGEEVWAYVPNPVMANMYKLADMNYDTNHQYFVDGQVTLADVQIGGTWKTILVAGLGAGGAAYFAIDVTDPSSPKGMWEFTNTNLGLTFAKPLVTKRSNGDWVVAITSGYNNTGGDGKGHLFLLNASTGALVSDIATSVGSATDPSGLGPANAWIDKDTDNKALRFYAGDQKGNLWRFDTEGLAEPKNAALLLANFTVGGVVQPITTIPQLAEVNDRGFRTAVVYVGTGRLVGFSDVNNTDVQSIYALKDSLGSTTITDVRNTMVAEPVTTDAGGSTRTAGGTPVDWSQKNGWYVDLPDSGERINIDMMLQFNILTAASNVPRTTSSCADGETGYAWIYYFNIANAAATAYKIEGALAVGLTGYMLSNGLNGVNVNTTVKGTVTKQQPTPTPSASDLRRSSWRELSDR